MKKCIICREDNLINKFSIEHIFPEAIGGTLELPEAVCEKCNNKQCNKADLTITNHFLIQIERNNLKLRGKRGNIPNPIENGNLVDDSNQKVKFIYDKNNVLKKVNLVPNINKISSNETTFSLDMKDIDELPKIIDKQLKRKGLPLLTEEQKVQLMTQGKLETSNIKVSYQSEEIKNPTTKMNASVDLILFYKGMLKIAYELAYYWFGESYLDDEIGTLISQIIKDDISPEEWKSKYQIKGGFNIYNEKKSILPISAWDNEPNSHIAFLDSTPEGITCYIRIFKVFEGVVKVSNNLTVYPPYRSNFIAINAQTGEKRESNLTDELNKRENMLDHLG